MGNCSCNCRQKAEKNQALQDEKQVYICPQCNAFAAIPFGEPNPECCGKKMQGLQ
jgi:NAD-dependent SIR2 family protein deacetylase